GNDLIDVKMSDSTTGVAVGWGGTIVRTTDSGQTWSIIDVQNIINTFQQYYFFHLSMVDANNIWAAGYSQTPGFTEAYGIIIKSSDGGLTWTTNHTNGSPGMLLNIQFMDAGHGIAVGFSTVNGWDVIRTTDGGNTWASSSTGGSGFAIGVFFSDLNNGTIVTVVVEILRTTDGGACCALRVSGNRNYLRYVLLTVSD